MLALFDKASSLVLANITMYIFDDLDEFEVKIFWHLARLNWKK